MIETTGTEDKIDSLLEVLRPYGVIEMVRTGRVEMARGDRAARRQRHRGQAARTGAVERRAAADRSRGIRSLGCSLLSLRVDLESGICRMFRQRRFRMAKMYYDKDADLSLIQAQEGRGDRLRLAGARARAEPEGQRRHVKVGLPATSRSRAKAQAAGLEVGDVADGVEVGRRDHGARARHDGGEAVSRTRSSRTSRRARC